MAITMATLTLLVSTPVGAATDIEVVGAVASPGEEVASVYFNVTGFASDDALVGVTSEVGEATMHLTEVADGITTMRRVDRIAVGAGDEIRFAPGGAHVMLESLREPLEVGERVELRLEFEQGTELAVPVEVVPIGELPGQQITERPRAAPSGSSRENDQSVLMLVTALLTLGFIMMGGGVIWWRGQGRRSAP